MAKSRSLFLVVALFVIVACSSSSGPSSSSDAIVGIWDLQTWNGKALPALVYGSSSGYHEQIVSERFVVLDAGTYSMSRTYRYMPEARSEVQTGSGSWKKNGTDYVLGSGLVSAKISGGQLTVQWKGDGITNWVYAKGN